MHVAWCRLAERNTKLLRFLTLLDVRIHRLMHTVRYWAKLRRLSGSGPRLTSYALTLLVVYYLQSVKDPLIPSIEKMSQLAGTFYWCADDLVLLVSFFGRLWFDLIKPVLMSVCPSVRPSTKSLSVSNEIWRAGRDWWVMHDNWDNFLFAEIAESNGRVHLPTFFD